jgi:mono/diheme cytochrome c family protein
MHLPRPIIYALLVMTILALIPPALIARTRATTSDKRRIHLIQDMDLQGKFQAQQVNPLFADDRAMRPPVIGTVALGQLDLDDHYQRGIVPDGQGGSKWAEMFPKQVTVDMALLRHGQERFNIYCRPCHGDAGYGDGIINKRAMELMASGVNGTTWVQPKNIHEQAIREQPVGQLFNTATHGIRTMAGYESQIPVADRWAIIAYVKALQRSQHANTNDVPASERDTLPTVVRPSLVSETPPGAATQAETAPPVAGAETQGARP